MRTYDDICNQVTPMTGMSLPVPPYTDPRSRAVDVGLCVPSMQRHMTDEGWQLFAGLNRGSDSWWLEGYGLEKETTRGFSYGLTDVQLTLEQYRPRTVLLQDKREWEGRTAGKGFDNNERFGRVTALNGCGAFVGTVLKDAQNNPEYHRESAAEIGAHFWVTYYNTKIVSHVAPYVRPEHCVRTYHSLDRDVVPAFSMRDRQNSALLSGAVSGAYPLRSRLMKLATQTLELKSVVTLGHPGYHRLGTSTPDYIRMHTRHKVAICTSSKYGYALRKIIEATAAGCRVITDLPTDEVLPEIDGNLVRISTDITPTELENTIRLLCDSYDPFSQEKWSRAAVGYYDYRVQGKILADNIEALRKTYP